MMSSPDRKSKLPGFVPGAVATVAGLGAGFGGLELLTHSFPSANPDAIMLGLFSAVWAGAIADTIYNKKASQFQFSFFATAIADMIGTGYLLHSFGNSVDFSIGAAILIGGAPHALLASVAQAD